jgi:hypothetical protein
MGVKDKILSQPEHSGQGGSQISYKKEQEQPNSENHEIYLPPDQSNNSQEEIKDEAFKSL